MWFRGRQPETSVWKRFRSAADGFVFTKEDDYYSAHVVANAERIVDLFLALMEQLPPAVDLVDRGCARASGSGAASDSPLPDVRDALTRIKTLRRRCGRRRVRRVLERGPADAQSACSSCSSTRAPIAGCICCRGRGSRSGALVRTKSWKAEPPRVSGRRPSSRPRSTRCVESLGLHAGVTRTPLVYAVVAAAANVVGALVGRDRARSGARARSMR